MSEKIECADSLDSTADSLPPFCQAIGLSHMSEVSCRSDEQHPHPPPYTVLLRREVQYPSITGKYVIEQVCGIPTGRTLAGNRKGWFRLYRSLQRNHLCCPQSLHTKFPVCKRHKACPRIAAIRKTSILLKTTRSQLLSY